MPNLTSTGEVGGCSPESCWTSLLGAELPPLSQGLETPGLEATGAEPAASGTQQPLKGGWPWPALKQRDAFEMPAQGHMELHKCSSKTAWWPGPSVIRVRLEASQRYKQHLDFCGISCLFLTPLILRNPFSFAPAPTGGGRPWGHRSSSVPAG